MNIMKKKTIAWILAGAMTLVLAGCGSSSSNTAASSADTAAAAASTAAASAEASATAQTEAAEAASTTAAAGSADLSSVIEGLKDSAAASDGVLTVGTNATFPPFEYIDTNGDPTGFDMALIKEIGNRLNLDVEIDDMDFDGIVGAIGGKIDVGIAGMTVTDERKEAVNFSDPYYDATLAVILPKDSTIATLDDLKNATLECQAGSTGEAQAREINDAGTTSVKSNNQAVLDLVNGKVQAVILDQAPSEAFQSQYPDQLKVLPGSDFDFETEEYAIAVPKDDDALLTAVNAALQSMKDDGTYEQLVDEYINNYSAE